MHSCRVATIGALSLFLAASAFAQTPRVDFARDVQPILRQHCISCHGPVQRMNGFRLDRRSAAMRGGTFPVITPGNSAGSRFYLKLIGTQFGQQMPPAGKLSDGEIDILKRWLDEGAEWPDALAGESDAPPPNPAARRIMDALRRGDAAGFRTALAAGGAKDVGMAGGWTPLMFAALYGNADAVSRVLAAGADPNAVTESGTSALVLAAHDAANTRTLLEAGANPNLRPEDGRGPIVVAASRAGGAAVVKLLLDKGADPKALTSNRTTALRLSAAVGDAETMRTLIAGGADVAADAQAAFAAAVAARCQACADLLADRIETRTLGGPLIAAARAGDVDGVRYLLDKGADVNARDGAGRTALMQAGNTDAYSPDVVRLLLARGADASIRSNNGDTAASIAALRGGPLAQLVAVPGVQATAPATLELPTPIAGHTARAAVQKSLPLLQKTDATFLKKSGCVSCHHNSLTAHAVNQARVAGFPIDQASVTAHRARMPPFLEGWRESVLHGIGIPGAQDTVGYILYGLVGAGVEADAATDAMAHYLKGLQLADGRWRVAANRPPIESSEIEVTAVAMRALQAFAPAPHRAEYDRAVQAATRWLATAKPVATEDRAFQLLGLAWGRGDRTVINRLAQELIAEQRADGGWAPIGISGMSSDAYSTGQAMTALREAGALAVTAAPYTRGVAYLLRTQHADGSWHVRTRAQPVQAYFESDFPHGRDQFISAAATNWATLALLPVAGGPGTASAR